MELREHHLAMRFAGGIETKLDPLSVPPIRLLDLKNAVFTRASTLSKRKGYTSLGMAVLGSVEPYALPRGLGVRGDDLVLFNEGSSLAFVEGSGAWHEIGPIASVKQWDRPLVKTISAQTAGDYAAVNGIGVAAWEDSRGGVWFSVVEDNEGRVILGSTQLSATGSRPRCVRCENKLAVLYVEAASGQLWVVMVDTVRPHTYDTGAFPRMLTDDLVPSSPGFDAVWIGDQNQLGKSGAGLCWNSLSGVRVAWLDPSGRIGSAVTGWPPPGTIPVVGTVAAGPTLAAAPWQHDKIAVAWATSSDVYMAAMGLLSLLTSNPSPTITTITTAGIGALTIAWRYQATDDEQDAIDIWTELRVSPTRDSVVTRRRVEYGGAVQAGTMEFRGSVLASKAWTDGDSIDPTLDVHSASADRTYAVLLHDVPLFGVYLAMREDGLCVARTLPSAASTAASIGHLPSATWSDRVVRWCAVSRGRLNAVNSDVFTDEGLRLISMDFAAADSHQSIYIGRTLYLGGGCLMAYDGRGWVEASPHYAPDWPSGATIHANSNGVPLLV